MCSNCYDIFDRLIISLENRRKNKMIYSIDRVELNEIKVVMLFYLKI